LEAFAATFEAVSAILLLVAAGFFISMSGKVGDGASKFVSWLVVNVSLPCMIFKSLTTSFSDEDFAAMPRAVATAVLSIGACYLVGYAVTKAFRVKASRVGIVMTITAQSNTIFMGMPVNLAIFGEASVPYVLYYYMANTVIFWSVGLYILSSRLMGGEAARFSPLRALKGIATSPPLYGLAAGMAAMLLKAPIPGPVADLTGSLGGLTTPLSMLFIGFVLHRSGLGKVKVSRDVAVAVCSRFLAGGGLSILIFRLLGLPPMMGDVFAVQATMPVMTNTAIICASYGREEEFAALCVSLSTVVSLALTPLVKALLLT